MVFGQMMAPRQTQRKIGKADFSVSRKSGMTIMAARAIPGILADADVDD